MPPRSALCPIPHIDALEGLQLPYHLNSNRSACLLEVGAAPNSHRLLGKLALDDTGAWRARYFNVTRPRHTSRFQKLLQHALRVLRSFDWRFSVESVRCSR